MPEKLEQLYQEARSALKARDYVRAGGLLRQILQIDENYKDASRLLAQTVQLRRRRWYNHPVLWGLAGVVVVIGLGRWLTPKISLPMRQLPTSTAVSPTITSTSSPTAIPSTATVTVTPPPTPVPLKWKRVSMGQEFTRDRVANFIIDPKDAEVLYARMEHAGYYRSIDGGNSWQPIQGRDIPGTILSELLVDTQEVYEVSHKGPDGKTRIYNNQGGTRWSIEEDGKWRIFTDVYGLRGSYTGVSFNPSGELYVFCGENICKFNPDATEMKILGKPDISGGATIRISPRDPNIIYVGERGMAVSKDGGYTWTKLNNGLGNVITQLVIDEGNQPTLYVLLGECTGGWESVEQPLYRSIDGGIKWEYLDHKGCYLVKDADGETVYRIATNSDYGSSGFYWQLSNKGLRWDKILIPSAITTLAAHSTQSGVLYAYDGIEPRNKYISENYGYTWKKDTSGSVRPCYGSTPRFIDAYHPMSIDPQNGDHVLYVEDGRVFESIDSCVSVTRLNLAIRMVNSIAFDPNNPDVLYAGTGDGAYISFDGGLTWGQINDGLLGATVVYSIVVDKDGNVYAATPYGIFKLESK